MTYMFILKCALKLVLKNILVKPEFITYKKNVIVSCRNFVNAPKKDLQL